MSSIVIVHHPSSRVDLAALEYISLFEVEDLRYDPSCYGPFLRLIPARLGHSETLDASAAAVAKSLRAYQRRDIGAEALQAYMRALRMLRIAIKDPEKSHLEDTLLSIYMVMICQVNPPTYPLRTISRHFTCWHRPGNYG
jgi:hypothetical protein